MAWACTKGRKHNKNLEVSGMQTGQINILFQALKAFSVCCRDDIKVSDLLMLD